VAAVSSAGIQECSRAAPLVHTRVMAKEKDEKPKEPAQKKKDKSVLESTAEAIGSTLGAIAVSTGLAGAADVPKKVSKKIPKLQKKNKSRLPRKQKKAALKKRAS
jgi:hypothetical protein